jgi:hypothetical protein
MNEEKDKGKKEKDKSWNLTLLILRALVHL